MLLVMLVAFDGRAEWLAFAMVQYLAVGEPLPGVHVGIAASNGPVTPWRWPWSWW